MTQNEFETMVKQYYKEGAILYVVAPGYEQWLNPTTASAAIRGDVTLELRKMARLVRDTAINGGKLVSFAHISSFSESSLDREVDVVATVGFDIFGVAGQDQIIVKKWRGLTAIPSPGVWPANK
ncbi:TPA: hypothetical protein ACIPA9_000149 [Salmonella enterica subsp. enterica serovar Java]